MQSQVRATTAYLESRKQFGGTLNTFQALTFRAAVMYVSLELAHSMVDWATTTIAGGDREAVADAADRMGLQSSRAGRHIGQEAIQLHGGIGMTAEYAVGVGTAHLGVLDSGSATGTTTSPEWPAASTTTTWSTLSDARGPLTSPSTWRSCRRGRAPARLRTPRRSSRCCLAFGT